MDKSKNPKREKVDIRKYVNYCLLMVAVVLVVFIGFKLYNRYQENKLGGSVFNGFVSNIRYEDIANVTNEMPSHGFILVSYVKNEGTNALEVGLKKSILNHELQNNFYYLDATDLMLNDGYIENLNDEFELEGTYAIEELPALLYYKEGQIKKTLSSTKERMMSTDDFNKLLDSYEIIERQ